MHCNTVLAKTIEYEGLTKIAGQDNDGQN